MATIEKRGESYRIIVSNGYDINGKQIRAVSTMLRMGCSAFK